MPATTFPCFLVQKDSAGKVQRGMAERSVDDLPAGEVLIRVQFSSLNYKDALAAEGHPGVARNFPHVPGIDAAGRIEQSSDPRFRSGDEVIVTGYELGAGKWGGWSHYIRVPADWVVSLPPGLSLREAMILGTAGFTAAQCVAAIRLNGVEPGAGEIVVTGATGGVGCLAVMLLAKLGYRIVAVTGKTELEPQLKKWGASRVIGRGDVASESTKPLLGARWAGAVDTVGGMTLTTIVRETQNYGVVAACGLVGGTELPLSVHPFILRGVTLAGIGSAALPADRRKEIWRLLSQEWKLDALEVVASVVRFAELEDSIRTILQGKIVGRTLVEPA